MTDKNYPEIPVMVHYECAACGKVAVAEAGSTLICDNCVNAFLARNVGTMVEVPVKPEPIPGPPRVEDPIFPTDPEHGGGTG